MPIWSFKLEWEVFDGVQIIATCHVDVKEIILNPYCRICRTIVRLDIDGFETLWDLMIHYFVCEAWWVCGAPVLGYVTTQLGRAVPVVFGPAGFIVSGVKIIVTCRRAPARSVDRSCLPCFIRQYISQVWRIFPCLG